MLLGGKNLLDICFVLCSSFSLKKEKEKSKSLNTTTTTKDIAVADTGMNLAD